MLFQYSEYGIILLCASIFCAYAAFYGYKNRQRMLYYDFMILMIIAFITFFTQGIESCVGIYSIKLLCRYFEPIGFVLLPACWLMMVYSYVHLGKRIKNNYKLILFGIPVIFLIFALTNPLHGLFWNITTNPIPFTNQIEYTPGIILNLSNIYDVILAVIVLILLIKNYDQVGSRFKNNFNLLILATIAPFIVFIIQENPIFKGATFTTSGYIVAIILIAVSIYRFDALNKLPVAYEEFINNINVGMMFFSKTNQLLEINPATELLNIKKTCLNLDINEIFKDKPEIIDFYNNDSETIYTYHTIEDKWIEINKLNLKKENSEKIGTILTLTDETSKKRELNQKEMLVKEVHHRVKNNLQIILSLLNLDMRFNPEDPESVLLNTRSRINNMAQLHEKIYKSTELDEVKSEEYISDLVNSILSLYDSHITPHFNMEDYDVNIEIAIPLGLILTEIINNIIKYAYPEKVENEDMFIDFHEDNDNGVLIVKDNGVGMPEDYDLESSTSLGMTVIKSLTQQIDGEFELKSENGTEYIIHFPKNLVHEFQK